MKYYRFYKMQQYVNGVPTETYSKGSLVDMTEYDDYATCMDNASTSTRWVTIGTVCSGTDLYENQQEEITYDGVNWSATGNTRIGSLIESGSSQCSSSVQDWRVVPGEGICQGHDLYTKEAEYINNVPTGNVRAGTLIKVNSADCGSITQWVNVPGEYVCLESCGRHDKYAKQKEQESYDGGTTWTDTGNVRIGNLIEVNSADCSCSTTVKRWVVVENDFICQYNAKYTKEKEQVSYDSGSTWEDTGNVRTGSLIEAESSDCSDVQYRWVDVSGQYTCENGSKYTTQKRQSSSDGVHWVDTGDTRKGTLIEEYSADCGTVSRWVTVPDDYMCEGTSKYYKEMQQYSIDGGVVWNDTQNFRKGTLIETMSEDCGVEYQWVVVQNDYVCNGTSKYTKEKQQVSTDSGSTWTDTGNVRAGTLIETLSTSCGVTYRWVTVANDYVCNGYDKYSKEKEQYSSDGGTTWTDTGNVRAGSTLIEANSEDCGYSSQYKVKLTSKYGPVTYVPVNSEYARYSWILNGTEVSRAMNGAKENVKDAVVYSSVTTIDGAFNNCQFLTSVFIPNSVTEIGQVAFYNCKRLTSVTIPNSVTMIGDDAFGASGLTSVTIPDSVTSIGKKAFRSSLSLNSITIGTGVTSIGERVLENCESLESISVKSGNEVYDSRNNCNAIIEYSTNKLIAGCKNTIIPNSVTSIGLAAFWGCDGLTSITIPDSVTSIGDEVFYNCDNLTSITCLATTPPTLGSDVLKYTNLNAIYVPAASVAAYKSASGWSTYASRIQAIS